MSKFMKKLLFLLLLFACFTLPAECLAQKNVRIKISVLDKSGRAVSGLVKEDLALFEGKTPLEIVSVEPLLNKPCAVLLLLDTSLSQAEILPWTKEFSAAFVQRGLQKDDVVAVAKFSNALEILRSFTSEIPAAVSTIDAIQVDFPPGYISNGRVGLPPPRVSPANRSAMPGVTNLWSALSLIGENDFTGVGDRRKTIVLLTDGVETVKGASPSEAADSLNTAGISVYAIGIGDDLYEKINDDDLRKIALATGGREFFPSGKKDLAQTVEKLKQWLASEYILTFSVNTPNKNKPGKLKLQITSADKEKKDHQLSYPQKYPIN